MPTLPLTPPPDSPRDSSIQYAVLDEGKVVAVRVVGKGNFVNSIPLQQLALRLQADKAAAPRFVIDLGQCPTMDSTFMGALAQMTSQQMELGLGQMVVCNANDQNVRLLTMLGLVNILDMRRAEPALDKAAMEAKFEACEKRELNKVERIVHMLANHELLVDLGSGNEVRFNDVVKALRKSLDEEKK